MRRSSAPLSLSLPPCPLSPQMFHTIVLRADTMAVTGASSPNNDTMIPPPPRAAAVDGRASRANRTVSLACEPAEELIKGWDCRMEREAVSASRAPAASA